MITKERLEELIEQKKSIYWKFAKIKPSSWSKYTIMGNTIVKGNLKEIYSLDDLFETKEDFEWHRQFGCIERTETLILPTWEEFCDRDKPIRFKINSYDYYCCKIGTLIVIKEFYQGKEIGRKFVKPLKPENYTLACRKAKELFLGEIE